MKYIILIIANFLFAGGVHSGGHGDSAEHHNMKNHWESPKEAKQRKNPIKMSKLSITRGSLLYSNNCVVCHGVNADGQSSMSSVLKPKPTNLKAMSGHHVDGDFAWKIENGKGGMPSWKNKLSQNDIWDLVNYIQSLKKSSKKHHH